MWHVAAYEYTRLAGRKGFWFGMLSLPAVIILMIVLIGILIILEINTTPIGYVDHSRLLENPVPAPTPSGIQPPVPMRAFSTEEDARQALDAGEIQGYYILPANYLQTSNVQLVYQKEPKSPAQSQFTSFILANLLARQEPQVRQRIIEGNFITVRALDNSRQMEADGFLSMFLSLFVAIMFFVAIFSTSGYLMKAVVEEKENRTMEMIITSISPNQLMAGKIIGNLAVGLTQILAWLLFIISGILAANNVFQPSQPMQIPWELIIKLSLVLLPCLIMLAGVMATVGAIATEEREGQQISGLIVMPIWLPYFLLAPMIENPNSPLAVALTLFPITAPNDHLAAHQLHRHPCLAARHQHHSSLVERHRCPLAGRARLSPGNAPVWSAPGLESSLPQKRLIPYQSRPKPYV